MHAALGEIDAQLAAANDFKAHGAAGRAAGLEVIPGPCRGPTKVGATALRCMATAWATSSDGDSVPSEAVEWVCRSISGMRMGLGQEAGNDKALAWPERNKNRHASGRTPFREHQNEGYYLKR